MAMEFRLLGPFEVRDDGRRIILANRRQERCLLGILLLEAGHVVTTERLAALLWPGKPDARGVVQTYVGRLRRSLAGHPLRIITRHDGYLIERDGHRLDTEEFAELSRRAAEGTDASERVRLYDEALALWRGPLLADVADDSLRERLAPALREAALTALRRRSDDLLAMGRHERVVTDLTPVIERLPGHEPLVALLMTALYRAGRAADALHRFDLAAKALDADLGVAPGDDLRELRSRVLRRDPRLDRPPAPPYAIRVRDQWLPWNVGGHPALEFCNTYAGWNVPAGRGSEWLRGYPALAAWAEQMDLADDATIAQLLRLARRAPDQAASVVERARQLRSHLYGCLTDPADQHAFAVVAGYAQEAVRASVLARGDSGLARWIISPAAGLELPLHAAANVAAELLADPRRFTVCACPGPGCGWLFLDPSGRRRFCSVATCGH